MVDSFDDAWLSWASAQDAALGSGESSGHLNTGSEARNIWVLGEVRGGFAGPELRQAIAVARELADELGTRVQIPVIGVEAARAAEDLIPLGADTVLKVEGVETFHPEVWTGALGEMIARHRPELVLVAGTRLADEVAPRLAVRSRTGYIADAIGLALDDAERLVRVTRAVLGGKYVTTSVIEARKPQVVALRPGAFREASPDRNRRGQVVPVEVPAPAAPRLVVGERLPSEGPALEQARRLVVGGKGVGDAASWTLLAAFAASLGAELGATRGAVAAGLAGPERLVGAAGAKVRPELLVTVGVSGSTDFLGAVSGARTLLAINRDADAPVMAIADFPLVGDLATLVPAWAQMLTAR